MDGFLTLRLALFGLFVVGFVYFQFLFAHKQWRRMKGMLDEDLDLEYVKIDDYLPRKFRAKVEEWLRSASVGCGEGKEKEVVVGRERLVVTGPVSMGAEQFSRDIRLIEGDFVCGARCRIAKELWVRGRAAVGEGSQLQAITADGLLQLKDRVSVMRWADADGIVTVGVDCRIGYRVTSRREVQLSVGSQMFSVHAPLVYTDGWDGSMEVSVCVPPDELPEIGPPEDTAPLPDLPMGSRLEFSRFSRLGPRCWLYCGNFAPEVPLRLTGDLVVKGNCEFVGGSLIQGNVKASGWLVVGQQSVCEGNLVAAADIWLKEGCRFDGLIHSDRSILLSSGIRGGVAGSPVAAYAGEKLYVCQNVALHGKLAAAEHVVALGRSQMEARQILQACGRRT